MSDDRFLWQGSPAGDAPPPPPPARGGGRRFATAGAVVIAAGAVVALVLVLAGSSAPVSILSNSVAQAASTTDAQAGYQFTMDIAVSVAGKSADIQASGSVSGGPAPTASMSMTVGGVSYTAVLVRPWEYLLLGGHWFKIDETAYQQAIGAGGVSPTSSNPTQLLHFLSSTGTVTKVGTEVIGGVQTTHYHAATDLSRYPATVPASERAAATAAVAAAEGKLGTTTLPIDAWIDGQHRVRRIVLAVHEACTSSGPADETVTMNLFDYGPQTAPALPGDATDITSETAAAAAAQHQQSVCSG